MILPDEHLPTGLSLIAIGATVLDQLRQPRTVNDLWEAVRSASGLKSFHRFSLAVSFLYTLGAVDFVDGESGLLCRIQTVTQFGMAQT